MHGFFFNSNPFSLNIIKAVTAIFNSLKRLYVSAALTLIFKEKVMRVRVRLDTMTDIQQFVAVATTIPERVSLEDDSGNRVCAKSLLGALYTVEWNEVYCYCDRDISGHLAKWII